MDLIYTDKNKRDLGILNDCEIDFEISNKGDECDFEIKIPMESNPIQKGYFIYIEDSECGGIVDAVTVNTAKREITLNGRNWRGVLASKILVPDSDYFTWNGNITTAFNNTISDLGIADLFEVVADPNAPELRNFRAFRFADLYSTMLRAMAEVNCKATMSYYPARKKVIISILRIAEYTNKTAITSDLFDFEISSSTPANHIIGLGSGQLSERYVSHRYLQADGKIGTQQYYFGVDEITKTYEDANLTPEEMDAKIEEVLKSDQKTDSLKISSKDLDADIGDMFTAEDLFTGISVTQYVTNKIVTINAKDIKIQYKVGNKL